MITKLYIDNYLCFSNFELELGPFTLLLGGNGSGKSSILDVIESIRGFVIDRDKVHLFAPTNTLTRWDTRKEQRIAMTVVLSGNVYEYEVVIDHSRDRNRQTVLSEKLTESGKPLFVFEDSKAHIFDDNHIEKSVISLNAMLSPLGVIQESSQNKNTSEFLNWLSSLQLVRPDPKGMLARSEGVSSRLDTGLRNFADWLRGKYESGPARPAIFNEALKNVFSNFETLGFDSLGGDSRLLVSRFSPPGNANSDNQDYTLRFDEFSEGQKLLCVMYGLVNLFFQSNATLMLDEPDNYLALSEIQPWFLQLQELTNANHQVFMVSHHPEILNEAAVEHGVYLWRDDNGPVRSRPFREVADQFDGSLPASQIIARGWAGK